MQEASDIVSKTSQNEKENFDSLPKIENAIEKIQKWFENHKEEVEPKLEKLFEGTVSEIKIGEDLIIFKFNNIDNRDKLKTLSDYVIEDMENYNINEISFRLPKYGFSACDEIKIPTEEEIAYDKTEEGRIENRAKSILKSYCKYVMLNQTRTCRYYNVNPHPELSIAFTYSYKSFDELMNQIISHIKTCLRNAEHEQLVLDQLETPEGQKHYLIYSFIDDHLVQNVDIESAVTLSGLVLGNMHLTHNTINPEQLSKIKTRHEKELLELKRIIKRAVLELEDLKKIKY